MSETLKTLCKDGRVEHSFQRVHGFSGLTIMQYTRELRGQAMQLHRMKLVIEPAPVKQEYEAARLVIRREDSSGISLDYHSDAP